MCARSLSDKIVLDRGDPNGMDPSLSLWHGGSHVGHHFTEEGTMSLTTLGIDIAKNVFHVHGRDAAGRPVFQKRVLTGCLDHVYGQPVSLPCGDGSVRGRELLESHVAGVGPRGAFDQPAICQTVREE